MLMKILLPVVAIFFLILKPTEITSSNAHP